MIGEAIRLADHLAVVLSGIVEAQCISKSYVSRILRLALLAPGIAEAILGGWSDQRVRLQKLEQSLPAG